MLDRLQTLKQAAAALEQNQLQPELRYSAEQAAHKLAGVLGMFERDAGTAVARQLEDLLSGSEPLKLKQIRSLLHPLIEIINTPVSEVSAVEISETSPEVSLGISPEVSPKISLEATAVLPSSRSAMLDRPHASVLAVDDDPVILEMLKTVLEPWGIQVTGLSDSSQFWQTLRAVSPDLLILDVEMPQIGGIDLCQSLRSELEWQALPVVFLTAHRGSTIIQQVFSVGADDYVSKPVMEAELVARINNRLDRSRLLQTLSRQEPMTGLLNQPASSHALKNLLSAYPQGCLLLFQIQNLRQIQRRYGHAAGHLVLQRWGKLFQQRLPDNSVMGYWGEGEFVVGLPQISAAQVTEAIGDLLAGLKQQVFKAPVENQFVEKVGKITGKITDRFQVQWDWMIVSFPDRGQTVESLYEAAWTAVEGGRGNERESG
ncbi:response regulator [Leptolyngbya ohadii]|uniref:response regulator n=1 Tax=Leptolyngbya ohadii TaxID=1962290 RepID=UPI0019D44F57|nr:response regulator [Leptolyngbya ohadii]